MGTRRSQRDQAFPCYASASVVVLVKRELKAMQAERNGMHRAQRPRPQVSLGKTLNVAEEWCLTWSVLEVERLTRYCIIKYPVNHIMYHVHYRKYTWNILGKNNFIIFVSKILPWPVEAEFLITFLYGSLHFPLGRTSLIPQDRALPLELCLYCFLWEFH